MLASWDHVWVLKMYIFVVKIIVTKSDQIQKNSGLAGWRHLWLSWILERYIRRWLHKCLKSTEPRQALQKNIKPSVRLLRAAWLKEGPLLRNDSAATASTARYTGAGPATPSASSLDAFIREELLPQLLITPPPSNEPISLSLSIVRGSYLSIANTDCTENFRSGKIWDLLREWK